MKVDSNWVRVTHVSGVGALLQKHGLNPVQISYAPSEPTIEDLFVLHGPDQRLFADTKSNEFVWARAPKGDAELTYEEVDSSTITQQEKYSSIIQEVEVTGIKQLASRLDAIIYLLEYATNLETGQTIKLFEDK